MFGSLFSSLFGGGGGGGGAPSSSSNSTTTSTTDDSDIAATDNANVNQYRLDNATDVTVESVDGRIAMASIAAILDTTEGTVSAIQANSSEAFDLVNEQARAGSERMAESTINGIVIMGVAAAIAYAIANRKGK